jgi:hypothetical protein
MSGCNVVNRVLRVIDFSFRRRYDMKQPAMEKIDPLPDHLRLQRFAIGQQVQFRGKPCTVLRRTTLASGEPAVVLGCGQEQFEIGASQFLAAVKP